jgi:hypothetical protein
MLVLSAAMRTLYLNEYETLIACAGTKRDARDAARDILEPIDDAAFWGNVAKYGSPCRICADANDP